jgi:hypothetical protein
MRFNNIAWLILLVAGCGGGTPPKPNGYQLQTPDLPLAAGEEKYLCYTVTLTESKDVAVTQFSSSASAAVHHFEIFRTVAPEPAGLFDCSQTLIKQTWLPLFGGGVAAGGLQLPAGAGFQIPRNAQLLLQLHLLNATKSALTTRVSVEMTYAADATKVTPAGIFAIGSMNINLPAGASGTQIATHCALPKALNVFAVQPHMHQLGTRITFEHGTSAADASVMYQRDPWVFGAQPIDLFTANLASGDYVGTTCTYDNPTAQAVTYGESTKNEMCYFVLFYTPFDMLDGCIS